jgi:hypothetical protein
MSGMQNDRQSPQVVSCAVRNFGTQLAILTFAFYLASPMFLHAAQVRGADEDFPVVHNDIITIRILDGSNGQPIAHAHLSLYAGYNRRDLHLAMWHDDVSTDDHGQARLPNELANLPFLQIGVAKEHICQAGSGSAIFSVDRIRRDGMSAANGCGKATFGDAPGAFTVFVKSKIHPPKPAKPLKLCKVRKPAPVPASAAAPASASPATAAPPPTPAPAPKAPAPAEPPPATTPVPPDDLRALAVNRLPALA